MLAPTPALEVFRRRAIARTDDGTLPAVFVLDAPMHVAAAVVASFHPVATLQILGGARRTNDAEVAETVEHAVQTLGARTVVVCCEDTEAPASSACREILLSDCQSLAQHLWLGRIFREHEVTVEGLFFDKAKGDLYLWDAAGRHFELLADAGLRAFFDRVRERAHGGL